MLTHEVMLKELRDHLTLTDMSQAEFARRVGVTEKHVSNVLNFKALPPLNTLDYWAFVLGLRWDVHLVKDDRR